MWGDNQNQQQYFQQQSNPFAAAAPTQAQQQPTQMANPFDSPPRSSQQQPAQQQFGNQQYSQGFATQPRGGGWDQQQQNSMMGYPQQQMQQQQAPTPFYSNVSPAVGVSQGSQWGNFATQPVGGVGVSDPFSQRPVQTQPFTQGFPAAGTNVNMNNNSMPMGMGFESAQPVAAVASFNPFGGSSPPPQQPVWGQPQAQQAQPAYFGGSTPQTFPQQQMGGSPPQAQVYNDMFSVRSPPSPQHQPAAAAGGFANAFDPFAGAPPLPPPHRSANSATRAPPPPVPGGGFSGDIWGSSPAQAQDRKTTPRHGAGSPRPPSGDYSDDELGYTSPVHEEESDRGSDDGSDAGDAPALEAQAVARHSRKDEYTVEFLPNDKKLGMLLERHDEWRPGDEQRMERAIVKMVVDHGPAQRVGVTVGSKVLAVAGRSVDGLTYADTLEAIKSAPRPLRVNLCRGTEEQNVGYCLYKKTIGVPVSFKAWKRRYFVVGGAVAKPHWLQLYTSKQSFDRCVIAVFQQKRSNETFKVYKLTSDYRCSEIKQTRYKGAPTLHSFHVKSPDYTFKQLNFASEKKAELELLRGLIARLCSPM